jgi:hypothetical protein
VRRRHKITLGVGLIVILLAWFAWTVLTVESDLAPGGAAVPEARP